MKRTRIAALTLAASLVTPLSFAGVAFASTSASPAGQSSALSVQDTAKSGSADQAAGTATSDPLAAPGALGANLVSATAQCDLPVAKRTGAWTCLGSPEQQSGGAKNKSGGPGVTTSNAQSGDYCLSFAPECWGVNNDFNAEFDGKNTYGYKDKVLGTVELETTWQLTGTQSVSKPVIARFSDPVRTVFFEADRLYYNSGHRSGAYFNPPVHDYRNFKTAIGYTAWPGQGAVLREGSVSLGGVIQNFSWEVPGYSGTWITYVKSPQFIKDGNVYRFMSARNLPEEAWGAYYRP